MENFMELCRLCMNQNNRVNKKLDMNLADKIYQCIGLKLNPNEKMYPSAICLFCCLKVDDMNEFRDKCFKVQDMLWALVNETSVEYLENQSEDELTTKEENLSTLANEMEGTVNALKVAAFNSDTSNGSRCEAEYLEGIEETLLEYEATTEPAQDKTNAQVFLNGEVANKNGLYRSLLVACSTCGQKIYKQRLEGHQNRHLGIRPYECVESNCVSKFYCKISLRSHVHNTHSKDRQLCVLCEKTFKCKKNLYLHKQACHNERIFQCTDCTASFPTNNQLKRHFVIHEDNWKYPCTMCSKKFYRKINLTVHMRSHTKEKPFSCQICCKSFGYKRVLKEHLTRIHRRAN